MIYGGYDYILSFRHIGYTTAARDISPSPSPPTPAMPPPSPPPPLPVQWRLRSNSRQRHSKGQPSSSSHPLWWATTSRHRGVCVRMRAVCMNVCVDTLSIPDASLLPFVVWFYECCHPIDSQHTSLHISCKSRGHQPGSHTKGARYTIFEMRVPRITGKQHPNT